MEAEWGEVSPFAAAEINRCRTGGGHVIALGTTSLRLLESAVGGDGTLEPFSGDTDLIHHARLPLQGRRYPDHEFPPAEVDAVHAGLRVRRARTHAAAYEHAMAEGYRFYSYGDACLLSHGAGT